MNRRQLAMLGAAGLVPRAFAVTPPRRIGVLPGPHAEIMAVVQRVAADRGLALELAERDGGRGINADVAAGRLDAACFQDEVAFAAERPARLATIASTVTLPVAIYSRRVASVRALRPGSASAPPWRGPWCCCTTTAWWNCGPARAWSPRCAT